MTAGTTHAPSPTNKWVRLTPIILLVGALALRLLALGRRSLWSDEAFSWWFPHFGAPEIWARGGDPHHPPLYYMILGWVVPFSESEFALRLPSAIASAGTVLMVYLTAKKVCGNPRAAILAGVLVAVSPIDIWYAQEARQAAMATFLTTTAAYGLIRRDAIGRTLGIVALAASFFTYYVTVGAWAVLLGVGAFMYWKERRKFLKEWLIVSTPGIVLFVIIQGGSFVSGFASLLSRQDRAFVNALMSVGPGPIGVLVVAAVGSFAAAAVARSVLRAWPRLVTTAGLAAYAVALAIPFLERGYSLQRVVLVLWPIAVIFIAYAAVEAFEMAQTRAAGLVLASVALAASLASIFLVDKDDWRSAVAIINEHAAEQDAVWMVDYPRDWEAPPGVFHVVEWGAAPYEYYGARPTLLREDDDARFGDLVAGVEGDIWVIGARTPRDEVPNPGGEAWLDEHWTLEDEFQVHRRAIRRYSRP